MTMAQRLVEEFRHHFGTAPIWVARAPGRINLIGDHTDYNGGFVLPMAIDRWVWIAIRPRSDQLVRAFSLDFCQAATVDLANLKRGEPGWAEYVKGQGWAMLEAGYPLLGWDGIIVGDIPVGGGLASSAALEMATAQAFVAAGGFQWDAVAAARLGQRAENEWVGVRCGIMDQLASAAGVVGNALLIDCRTLLFRAIPLPASARVVVLDTATRRGLVDSAYNERRAQCEQAAMVLSVSRLCDASLEELEACGPAVGGVVRRRARHVLTENLRTVLAAQAMQNGDAAEVGRLMALSHASLRDDFEVSSPALDTMVAIASRARGCYGARMTGAGFGGCAIALVQADAVESFCQAVPTEYRSATGHDPAVYACRAEHGADVTQLE